MLNKSFFWFLGSIVCALIAFSYLFSIYLQWDEIQSVDKSGVEVTLPVINWEKYQDLSKRGE